MSSVDDSGRDVDGSTFTVGPAPTRATRPAVIWAVAALLAVVVLIALFLLGQRVAGTIVPPAVPTPTAAATATANPTPTPVAGPTAIQPAGVHAWNTLFGGECLQPYISPWEEEFTVTDCATEHSAQLTYRGTFDGDVAAVFPGEAALASRMNLLCSAPGVLDLTAAGAYPDLEVQASFPVTAQQWTSGGRDYYCFVSRSSGAPMTSSVSGPGPAA